MNILKKNLAPITNKAWSEIDDQVSEVLKTYLTGRNFVDIDGPYGLEQGGISTGKLIVPENQSKKSVNYGIREYLPMVEIRKPFELDVWELDNLERGAEDVDLSPLEDATKEIALFEEAAIYKGFDPANIVGLKNASEHDKVKMPTDPNGFIKEVGNQLIKLKRESVEGPYSLIIKESDWVQLLKLTEGYPITKQLSELLGGQIIINHTTDNSFIVSERGDDYELIIGQDISIGYDHHDSKKVKLYLTSSFTFKVNSPEAIVVLE